MRRIIKQKRNIYKLLFFVLFFLNLFLGFYLLVKYPRFYFVFQKQIEAIFDSRPMPIGNYLKGIDVSEYQGVVNWKDVCEKQGNDSISFVFIRSTAGNNHRDRFFTSNYRELKKIGIPIGVYHYYRPNESSTKQADFYIKNVKLSSGDFPPILDIEKTSDVQSTKKLKKGIKNWLSIVEDHYGVKPILYTYSHFYNSYLKDDFSDYLLWIANYNNVQNPISSVNWQFWQYSEKGNIKGVKGPVDLDVFKGSENNLANILLK